MTLDMVYLLEEAIKTPWTCALLALVTAGYLLIDWPIVYPGIPLLGAGRGTLGRRAAGKEFRLRGREMVREFAKVCFYVFFFLSFFSVAHTRKYHIKIHIHVDTVTCLTHGCQQTNEPFQVITETATKIFLPPRYAEEIKDVKELSFTQALAKVGFLLPFCLVSSSVVDVAVVTLHTGVVRRVQRLRAHCRHCRRRQHHPDRCAVEHYDLSEYV